MAYRDIPGHCEHCGPEQTFRKHRPEHLLHFALSVISGGIWIPVWILASVFPGPYRCRSCGDRYVAPRRPMPRLMPAFGLLAALLLAVGLAHGLSGDSSPRRVRVRDADVSTVALKPNPEPELTGPVLISASDLAKQFREGPSRSERRYSQVDLVVNGTATFVRAEKQGGQHWLIFQNRDGEPLVKCLVSDASEKRIGEHFAGNATVETTVRGRLLGYTSSGSLTLHRVDLLD